jgi:hypothetical protein
MENIMRVFAKLIMRTQKASSGLARRSYLVWLWRHTVGIHIRHKERSRHDFPSQLCRSDHVQGYMMSQKGTTILNGVVFTK